MPAGHLNSQPYNFLYSGFEIHISEIPHLRQPMLNCIDMIDIHSHPLWEVDDGAATFEDSIGMCMMAAQDGITHMVATPHCNYTYVFDPEVNRQKLAELQAAIGESLKLLLGCDFHLSYDNIQKLDKTPKEFTINQTSYLLVEFPDQFVPEQFDRIFYDIQVAGLVPIITHPERNPVFARKTGLLYHWVLNGCLSQVTAQSYMGDFGEHPRQLAEKWLDLNLVHFFATDAHSTKFRCPVLSECYRKVAETKGEATAERLLKKNPEAVINDLRMPYQPPPLRPEKPERKRSWFSFLPRR
jgi:protein-tyrosine phosphatase